MPSIGLWSLELSLRHIYRCVYVDSSEQLKIFLLKNGFCKISCDYILAVCSSMDGVYNQSFFSNDLLAIFTTHWKMRGKRKGCIQLYKVLNI